MLIRLEHIEKTYGTPEHPVPVLHDVNFEMEEGGYYAIGVDSDQKYINDAVIICSMKKEVGTSIYDAISRMLFVDTSMLGQTWVADMSNGYVGIGYGEAGSTQQIPDEIKAQVEEIMQKIVSGEIKVETTRK